MNTFQELGVSPTMITALKEAFQIETPMEIQSRAIMPMSEGKNLILQAMTGSGKTLAYVLPVLARLDPQESANRVLIVAPTHELVMQIRQVIADLGAVLPAPHTIAALSGGANIRYQLESLKQKPQILIGTPGRLLELFDKKKINGQTIQTLILDEADELLNGRKSADIEKLRKKLLRDVQMVAVSASFTDASRQWLNTHMPEAADLSSKTDTILNPDIRHLIIPCEERRKFDQLRKALAASEDSQALVFINDPDKIEQLVERLQYHHYNAAALYADMHKELRKKTLQDFRQGLTQILVSSDLGARGLDLPGVDLILNMDFPLTPLSYVHRAGRTGRAGQKGYALSFVAPNQSAALRIYARDLAITFEEAHLAEGALILGPAPSAAPRKKAAPTKKTSANSGHKKRPAAKRKPKER